MKIKRSQLKQLIKEEVSKAMNEMAIDEMAFSMDDLEIAKGEVAASDTAAQGEANQEEFMNLLSYFVNALNKLGGKAVVEKGHISPRDIKVGAIDPYNPNLAVIYKVLSGVNDKMLKPGVPMVLDPLSWDSNANKPMGAREARNGHSRRTREGLAQFKNKADELISVLDRIITFAFDTGAVNAPGHEEPYLSIENAEQLKKMVGDIIHTEPYGKARAGSGGTYLGK